MLTAFRNFDQPHPSNAAKRVQEDKCRSR